MKLFAFLFVFFTFIPFALSAQESFTQHRIGLVLGHTATPEGIDVDGNKTLLFLPSWGLNYDFHFTEAWSLGLHNEMIIENFIYESKDGEFIERSIPFSMVVMAGRKFGNQLTLYVGLGSELAKESNLFLARLGVDYGWELPGNWEIAVSLDMDYKLDAYNSGNLGFGIIKGLGKKEERLPE